MFNLMRCVALFMLLVGVLSLFKGSLVAGLFYFALCVVLLRLSSRQRFS